MYVSCCVAINQAETTNRGRDPSRCGPGSALFQDRDGWEGLLWAGGAWNPREGGFGGELQRFDLPVARRSIERNPTSPQLPFQCFRVHLH